MDEKYSCPQCGKNDWEPQLWVERPPIYKCKHCGYEFMAEDLPKIYVGDYVHSSVSIGKKTKIGAGHDIGKGVTIGDDCLIQCHVSIPNGTRIGNRVFIGPGVKMSNDKYPQFYGLNAKNDRHLRPPIIEDDVTIGTGAIIGANVRIGKGALIAQGANVIKDVEPYTVVMGNPAKFYCRIDPETRGLIYDYEPR